MNNKLYLANKTNYGDYAQNLSSCGRLFTKIVIVDSAVKFPSVSRNVSFTLPYNSAAGLITMLVSRAFAANEPTTNDKPPFG